MILLAPLLSLCAQPLEPPPRFERLPNGLRVCLLADHTVPLVSVQLWYRVGSADDPPHQPGLCHVLRAFLEHREQAALRARAAGLRMESRTLRDAVLFETVLPADPHYLEFVLDLEAARMRPPAASSRELADALAADSRALAGGRGTAFTPSPEQAGEFLARWFVPSNATLLVIGDVQPDEVLEMIRQRCGGQPHPTIEDPSPTGPPRRPEQRATVGGFAAQNLAGWVEPGDPPLGERIDGNPPEVLPLRFAWRTPAAPSLENAALDVLMQRLCNPVDGPLYQRLNEAGLGRVRWWREAGREAGVLVLEVQQTPPTTDGGAGHAEAVRPGWQAAGQIIHRELERAAAERPGEIEFNRARNLVAGAILESRASFAARARRLGEHELIGGDLLLAEFELPRVQRIAVGTVQAAARTLLETRVGRVPQEPPAPTSPSGGPRDGPKALDTGSGRENQTTQAAETALHEPAPEEILDLLAAHAPALPMARVAGQESGRITGGVSVIRTVGAELATVAALGGPRPLSVTELRVRLACGSTRHSAAELRDYLSYHAIRPGSLDGAAALVGPKDRVPAMLELWGELLFEPKLEQAALEAAWRAVSAEQGLATSAQCADGIVENAWVTGTGRIVPATILGWQREMVKIVNNPAVPRFPVLILADVDPAAARESAERTFYSKLTHLLREEPPRGQDRACATPQAPAWPGGDPARVFWLPRRCRELELRVAWPIDREARAAANGPVAGGELRGALAAALTGAALEDQPAALDARRTRPWRARVLPSWHNGSDSHLVVLSRRIGVEKLASELARMLERVREIHDPDKPPLLRHTQTAMRLAVMALRLRAGFPIEKLPTPWLAPAVPQTGKPAWGDAAADPQMYWRNWLALSRPPQPIVVVVGGEEELRAELEKFGPVVQIQTAVTAP